MFLPSSFMISMLLIWSELNPEDLLAPQLRTGESWEYLIQFSLKKPSPTEYLLTIIIQDQKFNAFTLIAFRLYCKINRSN